MGSHETASATGSVAKFVADNLTNVRANPSVAVLYELAVSRDEGEVASTGALSMKTGAPR